MGKALWSMVLFASAATAMRADAQEMKISSSPEIGVEIVVPAGGDIYSYSRIYTIDGARLDANSGPGSIFRGASVAAGTRLVPVQTSKAFKACVPAEGTFSAEGTCFIDDDGDGMFDRQAIDEIKVATKLKTPVPYSRVPVSIEKIDSFRRVFLFQGATSDSLRFSYREFNNNLARPAFTEDLTIPRETLPAMVMIKNIQLEVLGVDGMGLRYRVVKAN